jgi:ribosomal protein S18 acetylase RimI-like enzyme
LGSRRLYASRESEQGVKERHKGHIYGVYLSGAYRGRGLGRAMIGVLLRVVRENAAVEQILLAVSPTQEAALCLYSEFGFEVYGIEPRALKVGSEYVDEHYMILRVR